MVTHEDAEKRVRLGFFIHFAVYALVVGGLAILNFTRNPQHLWILWVAGGWGLGVLFHAANLFLLRDQREKMVARTAERMDRQQVRRARRLRQNGAFG